MLVIRLFCVLLLILPTYLFTGSQEVRRRPIVVAGGGLTDFVTDTFTEGSDILLGSHTGELNATWTKHGDAVYGSVMNVDAASDRIFPTSNPSAFYASGVPADADYEVCADIFAHTNISMNIAPCGRMDTTANTMYCTRYNSGTSWELRKILAGVQSTLGSAHTSDLITLGTSKRVCLIMSGTNLSLSIDGIVKVGPISDSDIAAAGRAGVRTSGGATATTGFHLDNFSARQ